MGYPRSESGVTYQVTTEETAQQPPGVFSATLEWPLSADKPKLAGYLTTFFAYLMDIRRVFYTTNTIVLLNSVIRYAIKKRKEFPMST